MRLDTEAGAAEDPTDLSSMEIVDLEERQWRRNQLGQLIDDLEQLESTHVSEESIFNELGWSVAKPSEQA